MLDTAASFWILSTAPSSQRWMNSRIRILAIPGPGTSPRLDVGPRFLSMISDQWSDKRRRAIFSITPSHAPLLLASQRTPLYYCDDQMFLAKGALEVMISFPLRLVTISQVVIVVNVSAKREEWDSLERERQNRPVTWTLSNPREIVRIPVRMREMRGEMRRAAMRDPGRTLKCCHLN